MRHYCGLIFLPQFVVLVLVIRRLCHWRMVPSYGRAPSFWRWWKTRFLTLGVSELVRDGSSGGAQVARSRLVKDTVLCHNRDVGL